MIVMSWLINNLWWLLLVGVPVIIALGLGVWLSLKIREEKRMFESRKRFMDD